MVTTNPVSAPSEVPDGHNPSLCAATAALVGDDRITLMALLAEAHSRLVRILHAELAESAGVPLTWYDVLVRLGRAPGGHLTMTRLAGEVSLTSGGVTRLVDRMVEAGLVERTLCPSDRRAIHVALTAAGAAKLGEATAKHLDSLQEHLIDPLTPTERAQLTSILHKLTDDRPAAGG
jgi:DNA-binding MarR family transcriptional regulator